MNWLNYTNLSDPYERKTRFLPAVLCLLPLLLASAAFSGPANEWIKVVLGGIGIGAVVAVGLSHLASAMGNRVQEKLWPSWPHDCPTNRWLHPCEVRTSAQQRALWYRAIRRLVGIDIEAAIEANVEVEATINDAISALRNLFWNRPGTERLQMHNVDYGFARNLAGMRPIWISLLVANATACWIAYRAIDETALSLAIVSSILIVLLVPIGVWVLPGYVRIKATHYSESFFAALIEIDRSQQKEKS